MIQPESSKHIERRNWARDKVYWAAWISAGGSLLGILVAVTIAITSSFEQNQPQTRKIQEPSNQTVQEQLGDTSNFDVRLGRSPKQKDEEEINSEKSSEDLDATETGIPENKESRDFNTVDRSANAKHSPEPEEITLPYIEASDAKIILELNPSYRDESKTVVNATVQISLRNQGRYSTTIAWLRPFFTASVSLGNGFVFDGYVNDSAQGIGYHETGANTCGFNDPILVPGQSTLATIKFQEFIANDKITKLSAPALGDFVGQICLNVKDGSGSFAQPLSVSDIEVIRNF